VACVQDYVPAQLRVKVARGPRYGRRGLIVLSHEAVRDRKAKLTPGRRRRRGKVGRSWYVDETYVKVQGRWCYRYRVIDTSGVLVDVRLSETRDMAAARGL
jgi:transposase-like protein